MERRLVDVSPLFLLVNFMSDDSLLLFPQVGVGAVVFKDGKVLLVKRGTPPSQGLWAIPGGRLALGETLQQAAEREILEETGILIRAARPVYTFDVIERDNSGRIRFHYVIVDLYAEYIDGEPKAADDADEARWIGPDELSSLSVNDKTLALLNDVYGFGR